MPVWPLIPSAPRPHALQLTGDVQVHTGFLHQVRGMLQGLRSAPGRCDLSLDL